MASDWPRTFFTARLFLFSIKIAYVLLNQFYSYGAVISICTKFDLIEFNNSFS